MADRRPGVPGGTAEAKRPSPEAEPEAERRHGHRQDRNRVHAPIASGVPPESARKTDCRFACVGIGGRDAPPARRAGHGFGMRSRALIMALPLSAYSATRGWRVAGPMVTEPSQMRSPTAPVHHAAASTSTISMLVGIGVPS